MSTNNGIVLAVQWSVKYVLALNSTIFRKSCGEEEAQEG